MRLYNIISETLQKCREIKKVKYEACHQLVVKNGYLSYFDNLINRSRRSSIGNCTTQRYQAEVVAKQAHITLERARDYPNGHHEIIV